MTANHCNSGLFSVNPTHTILLPKIFNTVLCVAYSTAATPPILEQLSVFRKDWPFKSKKEKKKKKEYIGGHAINISNQGPDNKHKKKQTNKKNNLIQVVYILKCPIILQSFRQIKYAGNAISSAQLVHAPADRRSKVTADRWESCWRQTHTVHGFLWNWI